MVSRWPTIDILPFPVPDPSQLWGNPNCSICEGQCWGHFLLSDKAVNAELPPMKKPPSQILKEIFDALSDDFRRMCYGCSQKMLIVPNWSQNLVRPSITDPKEQKKSRESSCHQSSQTRTGQSWQGSCWDIPDNQDSEQDNNLTHSVVYAVKYMQKLQTSLPLATPQ